jgi:hypothetical protein
VDCYSCDNPAINACKRCAKTYCEDHGNAQYCNECLQPSSAMPSFNLYRGALLTMLVATALAVFLLIRPPGETDSTPLVEVGDSTATATPSDGENAAPTLVPGTPAASSTPVSTPTPAATPVPTEPPWTEYIVQEGDSLFGIAEAHLPPGDDLNAYVAAIAGLNNFSVDDPIIPVGATILLPKGAQ